MPLFAIYTVEVVITKKPSTRENPTTVYRLATIVGADNAASAIMIARAGPACAHLPRKRLDTMGAALWPYRPAPPALVHTRATPPEHATLAAVVHGHAMSQRYTVNP